MKKGLLVLLLIGAFFVSGCGRDVFSDDTEPKTPYYFVAIHNEPHHGEKGRGEKIRTEYEQLKKMISYADQYKIKLTLMFSPQWVEHIKEEDLKDWKKAGHEIAVHHHSIFHGNWDGYTNFSEELARAERLKRKPEPENYLGDLDAFMKKLKEMDSKIDSGCVNEENSKAAMPAGIIYSTCSGFANFGEPGRVVRDSETPHKGINEYISVGEVGGIKRKWLAHYQTTDLKREKKAEETFYNMRKGVFGSVNHSLPSEAEAFFAWLDFLHQRDREGRMSRTVSEVIDQRLIPEKKLP